MMLGILAMGIATSCNNEAPEIPATELYTREWVKNFGVMDASQDWNTATRGSVQVDVKGAPKRIRITTVIDDVTYLLADYPEVSGSQKLEFDIPRGLTDIKVMTANRAIRTQVGGAATFAETANNATSANDGGDYLVNKDGIKVSKADYLISDGTEPTHYRDKLPEKEFNVGKVPTNFEFTSNGTFIIYPIFWDTSGNNTVGIYTVNGETINYYPFYSPKEGDALQYLKDSEPQAIKDWYYGMQYNDTEIFTAWGLPATTDEFTDEDKEVFKTKFVEAANSDPECKVIKAMGLQEGDKLAKIEVWDWHNNWGDNQPISIQGYKYVEGTWTSASGNLSYQDGTEYKAWRSEGFKIDIEDGIKFGMYIQQGEWIMHSQVELNEYSYDGVTDEDGNLIKVPHASTYIHHCTNAAGEYNEYRVLAFEDYYGQYTKEEPDLNDVVFYVTSDNVEEIPDVEDHDASPIKWLIACEDLGSTDDFDFNDVVFEVEHVAGRLVATIRPLAAGGTLPTYLCRDGKRVNNREWHSIFGKDHTTMVNTGQVSAQANPSTFTIDVPADFSLTSGIDGDGGSIHENYKKNMGGFSLEVLKDNGSVYTVEAPGAGTAPQMILIFQKEDKKWEWPTERTNIKSAYPGFESWMKAGDFSIDKDGTNWYDNPSQVAGSTHKR